MFKEIAGPMAQGVLDNQLYVVLCTPLPERGLPLSYSPRGAFSPCLDLPGPPGTPQNSTLKNSPQTIGQKNRPGTKKVPKIDPKSYPKWSPGRSPERLFLFFREPWFRATLQWFCYVFTFPRGRWSDVFD